VRVPAFIWIVGMGFLLFWPRYDLEIAFDPLWKSSMIVEEGFWTLSGCREAAHYQGAKDYICLEYTAFGEWFNDYSKYSAKKQ